MPVVWATVKGIGRLFKVVVVLLTGFLLVVFTVVTVSYFYFAQDLPNIQTVSDYHPQLVTKIYGSDETEIGEFWSDERRILVPISQVPSTLISAFIAAEDSRFLEHRGIDFRGIMRALIANIKAGDIVQGGSTITQQVTRSLLLTRTQSYTRKIKEAILANRLERYLTKDQILYIYLNQIYFGNRAYGIKAAAENYFHKNLEDLNLAETVLLASLPRAPNLYSPFRHQKRLLERMQYVLNRLLEEKVISKKDVERTLQTKIKLYVHGTDKDTNLEVAPYFTEYLRQVLLQKYGEEKLYYGGLRVYTSIDPGMQKAARTAVRRGLEVLDRRKGGWRGPVEQVEADQMKTKKEVLHQQIVSEQRDRFIFFPRETESPNDPTPVEEGRIYPALVTGFDGSNTLIAVGRHAAVVPVHDISFDQTKLAYMENLYFQNPRSRLKPGDVIQVRAHAENKFSFYQEPLVQGALYAQEPATGLARAMVGGYDFTKSEFNRALDALRQPGSAFKPFVYSAALDKGYKYSSPLMDTPFALPVGNQIWSPKNYSGSYRGITDLHTALVHSYNVAAARVAYHIGFDYLTGYLRKMGITTPVNKYPSMALGANGVNMHEMVAAYSTFPNLGVYVPPTFITKVVDQEGNILEEYVPSDITELSQEKTAEIDLTTNEDDLNSSLYEANKAFIEKDNLSLSPSELRVLYGSVIPPGHVITPQTAYLMVGLMRDVVLQGTGRRVRILGKPVAGKTGTTNGVTDTWFIGYVPDLAAAAWVGYDSVRGLGSGEQGGRTAAPIFLDFMQSATQGWEAKDFRVPKNFDVKYTSSLSGGSAIYAELTPFPVLGGIYESGGSSADRSADFLEADFNAFSY